MKNQIHGEWSAFVKDDYKISRRLTLNLRRPLGVLCIAVYRRRPDVDDYR